MIRYLTSMESLAPEQLQGFFVGWPAPPSPATLQQILCRSAHVVVAVDDETDRAVGFINAISDGTLSAYIPLLEVLPAYQGRGIGSELVRRMCDELQGYYMTDLSCDPNLVPFYERFGMRQAVAMCKRNYARQSGC